MSRFWKQKSSWEEAEAAWDREAQKAAFTHPLKAPRHQPDMPGIAPGEERWLKGKSFWWMLTRDHDRAVLRGFLRHPLRYSWRYFRSLFQKRPYRREGDLFFYGISSEEEYEREIIDSAQLFVLGFSYCHKPFECPSGRFTDQCLHDPSHSVCRQCFIGKAVHAAPEEKVVPLIIPTVHYIGAKMFDLIHKYPDQKILFLITACELTLEMFGDWGNMVGIRGIGIRLGGRICNTMKAFALSEQGIKPGLTIVHEPTQKKMLRWIRLRREGKLSKSRE